MKHTPDRKPCGCIDLLEGVWVQRCDCGNSGDLAAAEAWCGDANREADLREALDALEALHEVAAGAIENGDWQVDGRCDPDMALTRSTNVRRKHGRDA